MRPTKKKGTRATKSSERKAAPKLNPLITDTSGVNRYGSGGPGLALALLMDDKLRAAEEQEQRELIELGREFRRRTSYVNGEPIWLLEVKEAYKSLGTSIALLSYEYDRNHQSEPIDPGLRKYVEAEVGAFFKAMRKREIDSARMLKLLVIVDGVVRGEGPGIAELLDKVTRDGAPNPRGFVVVAYALFVEKTISKEQGRAAVPVAEELVSLWNANKRSNLPGKWAVAAQLWRTLTGADVDPEKLKKLWSRRAKIRDMAKP